jgi:replicative DNA helicase
MSQTKICSFELEKIVLSGLFQYPEVYGEICNWISESDFEAIAAHKTIFSVMKRRLEQRQTATPLLVAEEVDRLGIRFPEIDNIRNYICEGLALISVNREGLIDSIKEIKKVTVAREIDNTADEIKRIARKGLNLSIDEIIQQCDEKYNRSIEKYFGTNEATDLFDGVEERLEERRKNPVDNIGLLGPYLKMNELYGSLVRPGNITTICARSGSYKTTVLLHYGASLGMMHDIPILHFDFGEMSKDELQDRQIASLTGIPLHLIETGNFGRNEEALNKVRSVYAQLKKLKYYYIPVGSKSASQMIAILKRTYFSKVGRGNPTALILDYWKSYGEDYNSNKAEWERFGKFTQDFKNCISEEIPIGICSGLQSNRVGIVTGKTHKTVSDDEGIASGGDRIVFHSSHFFILRVKTLDVMADEKNLLGNAIIKNVAKCRHLGKNVKDALSPVRLPDGTMEKNYINLDIQNFNVVEKGDLASIVRKLKQLEIEKNDPHHGDLTL